MSDVAIISICVTVLVALLIIHLMIKGGKGFIFRGKTKIGDFEIGHEASKSATAEKSPSASAGNDKKVDQLELYIEFLVTYRMFFEALSNASLGILKQILEYGIKNHVDVSNSEAFNVYVVERGLDMVAEIDKSFINSSSVVIRTLTCEKLLGEGYPVFIRIWQKGYKSFYENIHTVSMCESSEDYLIFIQRFVVKFGEVWVYNRTMLVDAFMNYMKKKRIENEE